MECRVGKVRGSGRRWATAGDGSCWSRVREGRMQLQVCTSSNAEDGVV